MCQAKQLTYSAMRATVEDVRTFFKNNPDLDIPLLDNIESILSEKETGVK